MFILFALGVENITPNRDYAPLPMHCTILQWAHMPEGVTQETVLQGLHTLAKTLPPIKLEVAGQALFGTNNDVPVTTLKKTSALIHLHEKAVMWVREQKGALCDPQWAEEGFNPHVSDTNGLSFSCLPETHATNIFVATREQRDSISHIPGVITL